MSHFTILFSVLFLLLTPAFCIDQVLTGPLLPEQLAPPILDERLDLLKRQGIERGLAKDLTVSDILVGQLVVVGQHHDLVQDHLPTWWTIHLFCLKDRAIVRTDHIQVKVLIFGSFLHQMAWSLLLLLQVTKVFFIVGDLIA